MFRKCSAVGGLLKGQSRCLCGTMLRRSALLLRSVVVGGTDWKGGVVVCGTMLGRSCAGSSSQGEGCE